MKHWFTKILALVAALTLSAGLKAQDGPVLSAKITEIAVSAVDYSVARIDISNGGTGYNQATTKVTISGGSGTGATATATVTGGVITAITVTNPGSGYLSVPAVVVSDAARTAAGNTEAVAVAVMGFSISKVTVLGGGAGYTLPPAVSFVNAPSDNGSGAAATAVLANDGTVKEVVITSGGGGYLAAPRVVFTPASGDTTGAGASAAAVFGYSIVNIGIVQPDNSVYLSPPSLTIVNAPGDTTGFGGAAKIILDAAGKVSGITVTASGQYYTKAPIVTINNDGVVSVPGGGTTLGGASILASATIGSIFEAPFQNESFGPTGSYIVISALAQGTFPVAGYTYKFFANGMPLGTALPVPILDPARVAWTPPQPGAYYIHAEISDGLGNTTKTLAVRYFATGTAIQSPMDNTLVPKGSSVVVQANAIGRPQRPNAFVKEVKFYVDGSFVASDTTFPYSMIYTPSSALNSWDHVIEARAFDNNGNQISADGAALINLHMIDVAIPSIPTVSIEDPVDGKAISVVAALSSGVNVKVKADGVVNKITRVELYVDGVLVDTTSVYPYAFNWKPAVAGAYNLVALAYDSKSNVIASDTTVGTNLTGIPQPTRVVISTPPSVIIEDPVDKSTVFDGIPKTVTIKASAYGTRQIGSVSLYVEGKYVADAVRVGASDTWTASFIPVLKYDPDTGLPLAVNIFARATDRDPSSLSNNGLSSDSDVRSLNVSGGAGGTTVIGQAPTVTVTSPVASSNLRVNMPVTIYANAQDPDGIISSVQFLVNNTPVGLSDSVYPYSGVWTPVATGNYTIIAKTVDNDGNVVSSSPVTVTVSDLSLGAPVVAVTSPVPDTVSFGSVVSLGATASDSDGSVSSVQFYVDGQPYSALLVRSPYLTNWMPDSPGVYNIVARATDNAGNQTTSAARTITVLPGSMPLVSVSSPADLSTVPVNAPTILTATASDNMAIASVQFYVNGVATGVSDTTYPYRVSWTPTSMGTYSIVARATDNEGNWTDSSVVTLTAVADIAPTVSIASPANGASSVVRVPLTIAANANDDSAVASVQFYVDNVAFGSAITVAPYSIQWTPMTPGTYAIKAVATDNMGNQTASAVSSVSIAAPNSPTSTVTSPTGGATLIVNNVTTLTATATDNVSIASVQFYINGVAQGPAITTYPYTLAWTPVSLGNYSIFARATDNEGNVTDSTSVAVSVVADAHPSVSVTAPVGGSTIQLRAATTLVAFASDDYQLASVQFYVDGVAVGPLISSAPWSTVWTPTNSGPAVITARAFDNKGQSSLSAGVSVTVSMSNAPSVNITAPSAGASVVVNNITSLSASASDNVSIASVQFLVNGQSLGSALTAYPYNIAWTPTSLGNYSIVARAIDNEGNVADSPVVSVSVVADSAPDINLISPSNGATISLRAPVTIVAAASDDYSVASVQFYIDGVAVGSAVSASPYTIQWIPTTSGTFSITAKATDNKGQVSTSSALTITVSSSNAPSVSITAPLDGSNAPVNAPTILQASATDNVTVASVQFFVNGLPYGPAVTSYPYTLAWTPSTLGSYSIVARATDNEGNTTDSSAAIVTVVVDSNPTVSIVSPTAGSTVEIRTPVTITASATDDSAVAGVQFLVNDVAVALVTASPYTITWTPTASGSYVIKAIAIDNKANQSLPATRTLTVTSTTAPSVSVTAPSEASSVPVNNVTVLKATATDNVAIASVVFLVNGELTGTAITSYPYNLDWTPTSVGTYTIVARATDNEGNRTDSAVRTVTVVANNHPTVTLNKPLNGSSVPVRSPTTLVAAASDSNGTVVSVQFYVNGAAFGSPVTSFPYKLDWTPETLGTFTLRARATDNEGLTTDSSLVTVQVISSSPPTVSLSSPFAGAELYIGAPITLKALAADEDGSVSTVQFYANGVLLGTSSSASSPYTFAWSPEIAGPYTLEVKATDNIGVITTSASVAVTVKENPAPIVSVTKPVLNSADQFYYTGAVIELEAIASDSDGTSTTTDANGNKVTANIPGSIKQVQFYVNDVLVNTDDTAPYAYAQWIPDSAGTYNIVAKATDSKGAVGVSNAVSITVKANLAPTVAITAPVASATLRVNTPVTINASASDPDGSVSKVVFYLGDTILTEDTEFPFTTSWTPVSPGRYTISARVYDNNDRYSLSTSVPVVVADPSSGAPTISITSPTASTAVLGTSVMLLATASDPDGSIASVEFYVDGKSISGLISNPPYSFSWTPASAGLYTVSARATDNLGNQTDSAIRSFTVSAGVAPVVTLTSPAANASYASGASVVFSATVTDANDKVASVAFIIDDMVEATLTSAPYLITRTISDARTHTFAIRATDAAGNVTTSPTRIFTIRSNQLPTVALVTPAVTSTLKVGSVMQLEASAKDNDGIIANVDFLVNDLLLSSTNTAPYKTSWAPLSEGVYKIAVLATDNAGDVARSADVYVRVTGDSLSSVDAVYSGTYLGTSGSGKFAFINEQGRGAAFISYSDTGATVSRYTGITIDSAGTFKVSSGNTTLLSGTASATGVSGYMGASAPSPMFLGTLSFVPGKIPPGLYTGSVVSRSTTDVTAIVSQDGQITASVADGSFTDAGRSTVSDTGAFAITMVGGSTLTGTLNLGTGFLTATLTGTVSGKVLASNSSAVAINDGTLLNLSTRGLVAPGKTLVAGFVVGGTAPKQILVRAIGPKLLSYGVPAGTEQPDPKLTITNVSNNTVVGTNDNWSGLGISTVSARIGAFALDEGSKDAVLLLTLAPGNYTAQVSAAGTATGVALVELFDVDTPQPFAPQKLLNISASAEVGGSEKTLTAGFVISGDTSKKVLIRAVGPTLQPYGVTNYLADPAIILRRLVNNAWVDVRENDNSAIGNDAALVRSAALSAGSGLQLLSTDTKSAELLVSLPAGTYTAEVRSASGSVGVVLVEVYEVP